MGILIFGNQNLKWGNLEFDEVFIVESIVEIPFYKKVEGHN